MKICDAYAALLDLYLDGELSPEEMVRVQTHLNECPACQAYVDDILAIRAALPSVEETVVPEGFADAVMSAISAKAVTRSSKKTPWGKILLPLAACCAIVILLQNGTGFRFTGGKAEEAAVADMAVYTEESAVETPAMESVQTTNSAAAARIAADEAPAEAILADEILPEPEAAAEDAKAISPYRICICVDAAYIGSLLDSYTPIESHTEGEQRYELTYAQYNDLLEALSDRDELPAEETFDTDSDMVLVIVRHS